jgi:hypothetical protein
MRAQAITVGCNDIACRGESIAQLTVAMSRAHVMQYENLSVSNEIRLL